MRTLLIGGALGAIVVLLAAVLALAAFGGSSSNSASEQAIQRQADMYGILQIDRNFHKAMSSQDIDLMMSQYAPNATWTIGPGKTLTGKAQIRRFFRLEAPQFQPENRWLSDTALYKIRITAHGDRGTMYSECHLIDVKTRKVVRIGAADFEVAKINGRWLVTNEIGASPTLSR
jgi:ketosteroid isomerase-like protein